MEAIEIFEKLSKLALNNSNSVVFSLDSAVSTTKLENGKELQLLKNVENINNAVELFFQCLPFDNVKIRVLVKLYTQIFSEMFLHELRTIEQIGYICTIIFKDEYDVTGVRFIVQSSSMNSEKIDERIQTFIETSFRAIQNSNEFLTIFQKNIKGLKSNLLEKVKFLGKETQRFWDQIINQQLNFVKNQEEANILDSITIDDLKQFVKEYFLPSGSQRRLISVWIGGVNNNDANLNNRILIEK